MEIKLGTILVTFKNVCEVLGVYSLVECVLGMMNPSSIPSSIPSAPPLQ